MSPKDAMPAASETPIFLQVPRREAAYRPVTERTADSRDVALAREDAESRQQASRCLDCGVPFCHWACPIGNVIPDWNRAVAGGDWDRAFSSLQATNNIPEVTARICPALCEPACVLGLRREAVTIREDELAVIEHAFAAGWVVPHSPRRRTGRSVAVVGSGPAGLCCADQLNRAGHRVVVFERDDRLGGLLRYGIPDFKLEKWVLDRRLAVWREEGIEFRAGVRVGSGYPAAKLRSEFDAVCLAGGCRVPRDLAIPGRELRGIHFAMDYLAQSNRRAAGDPPPPPERVIDAKGTRVVVIGGGDTGADCVGTAHRQGARRVVQIELLPQPPESWNPRDDWPDYPSVLRTSSSHQEGGVRDWAVLTQQFIGSGGTVTQLSCVRVEFSRPAGGGRPMMQEVPGSGFELDADLVLLALGFVSPETDGLLSALGVERDARGNVRTDGRHLTSAPGIFSAGDMRRGQSLVVWAVSEGRAAAHHIDRLLMGRSDLPLL